MQLAWSLPQVSEVTDQWYTSSLFERLDINLTTMLSPCISQGGYCAVLRAHTFVYLLQQCSATSNDLYYGAAWEFCLHLEV